MAPSITLRDFVVNTNRVRRPQGQQTRLCGMEWSPARLRQLRKAAGLTQEALALRCGFAGQSRIANYESTGDAGRIPSADELPVLAKAIGTTIGVLFGEADSDPDWDNIRGYAQAAGLGSSAEAQEWAEVHKLKFRHESLRRKGLHNRKLAVFYGKGDSMLPRIHSGDAILFDEGDTTPRDGEIYVILLHGAKAEYQVKRAMILDDVVYFVADNPAGDHGWAKPRRTDAKRGHIDVIGRVRWIGSWEG